MTTLKIVAAVALAASVGLTIPVAADPVPADMQASYKGKSKSYSTDPNAVKETRNIVIQAVDASTANYQSLDKDGNVLSTVGGVTNYLTEASSLLVRFDVAPEVYFTGSLQVKGKPGKRTLSGTLYTYQAGFGGFYSEKVRLKQVP